MKNLSKVLLFSLLTIISAQTFAQKFGIQGGLNLANMVWKDDEGTYSDDFSMNLGFNAGVTVEFGFGELLSLEAGILAETKGFKWDDVFGMGVNMQTNLTYIDVPVLLKVGPTLGPVKVFGAAGPYIGYGIAGKFKYEGDGDSETEDVEWGSDEEESDFKPLDYGLKFGIGAEASGFTFGAYYALGLANISPYTDEGTKISNNVISISVGYKFGK
jgi:hypothetical protein